MNGTIEQAPLHLRADIEQMHARLLRAGQYRPSKRGAPNPEHWQVSIEGARCGLLLGAWLGGLHHLPHKQQAHTIDWSRHFVVLRDSQFMPGLASFDGRGLTNLILLAHEHAIRVDLSPAHRKIELLLHPRDARCTAADGTPRRHPSLIDLRDVITKRIEAIDKAVAR